LSASIAELERIVGAPLMVRDRRRISLSNTGSRLLRLARSIEHEFRQAEAILVCDPALDKPARLGVLSSVPSSWLIDFRRSYNGAGPLAIVEGGDANLRRRLQAGQLDAVITLIRPKDDPVGPKIEEGYAVLMSASHRSASQKLLTMDALAGEAMVARRSCEILGLTSDFFTERGVRPHFLLRSSNEERCLELVRNGFAITTGPASLASDGIIARELEGYDFRRMIGFLFRIGYTEPALVTAWEKVAGAA
jgi:DNA-binding transcriptional LysR family regulator